MADQNNIPQSGPQSGDGQQSQLQQALVRFRALPRNVQIIIVGGFAVLFLMVFAGGNDAPQNELPVAQGTTTVTTAENLQNNDEGSFEGLETDRPALLQNWLKQQQNELNTMQEDIQTRFVELQDRTAADREELSVFRDDIKQTLETFQDVIRSVEESNSKDREVLTQLAEETRRMQMNTQVRGGAGTAPAQVAQQKERIAQVQLSRGAAQSGVAVDPQQALLGGIGRTVAGVTSPPQQPLKRPFVPPLGFIKGTLLNGVDAIAGGGRTTPALVRLSGAYRTAMNSTVNLDGCFAMVEFEGDISTERALGKPSRMTCILPNQGAVTYQINGYVVDQKDGVIGVPGTFYEGDPKRVAAAMLADFAAGVAAVIESNQSTTTTDAAGNATKAITGDQSRAEIAGGASKAIGSLRDYLMERANRILPFVRIDSTRDINLVFLSGIELEEEAGPWTLLFSGHTTTTGTP